MSWTCRDRVMAALSGERPDRLPLFDYLVNDEVLEHYGARGRIAVGDREAVVRACARCLDLCHPASSPNAESDVTTPSGDRVVTERWTRWVVPAPGRAVEDCIARLGEEIERDESYAPSAAEVAAYKARVAEDNSWAGGMVHIHLGTSCAFLPGSTLEVGILALAEEPELVRRWARARNLRTLRWLDAVADAADSPVAIIWNDVALKDRLLYPLQVLEERLFPPLTDFCDLLHARGMKVVFHSDGQMNDALEGLAECGIDGFNPLEISAGMGVERFFELSRGRIALVGGVDAVDVLALGTPDGVRAHTREFVRAAERRGGVLAGSSSGEIDNSMPLENVTAYFETIWGAGPAEGVHAAPPA